MNIKNKLKLLFFVIFIFVLSPMAATHVSLYSTQSGNVTLDQGLDGGNLFAGAFVDLLV